MPIVINRTNVCDKCGTTSVMSAGKFYDDGWGSVTTECRVYHDGAATGQTLSSNLYCKQCFLDYTQLSLVKESAAKLTLVAAK